MRIGGEGVGEFRRDAMTPGGESRYLLFYRISRLSPLQSDADLFSREPKSIEKKQRNEGDPSMDGPLGARLRRA